MSQQYPVCYILQHKKHGTFVPHTNFGYCLYPGVLKGYDTEVDKWDRYFTTKLDLVKMWPTHKKIMRFLTKEAAIYFKVVGSDQTVIDAETLFP